MFGRTPDAFDLIITDYTMPRLTGAELAREMLAVRPDIPIILCTGYSENISREEAESIGIRRYIMKPVVMGDLARNIRELLETSAASPAPPPPEA